MGLTGCQKCIKYNVWSVERCKPLAECQWTVTAILLGAPGLFIGRTSRLLKFINRTAGRTQPTGSYMSTVMLDLVYAM